MGYQVQWRSHRNLSYAGKFSSVKHRTFGEPLESGVELMATAKVVLGFLFVPNIRYTYLCQV